MTVISEAIKTILKKKWPNLQIGKYQYISGTNYDVLFYSSWLIVRTYGDHVPPLIKRPLRTSSIQYSDPDILVKLEEIWGPPTCL